jgi:predicted AlkP superfamily phosphohydrolase/phosphomutase
MRILVIGLDCAAPELLLGDDRLPNIRRLMEAGAYGRLESVVPPITVPAWMCLSTSQDPGSLGVYGFRNRKDHSYDPLSVVDSRWIGAPTIWDRIAMRGGRSIIIGVPPSYPPRRINGICVGCFLTPDTRTHAYTEPAAVRSQIESLVGDYPVDVKQFRTDDKDRLRSEIVDMTRKHFQVVRHFLAHEPWDYFQLVEIGLDRVHHGFWKHHDPSHRLHDPESPYRDVVRDYYRLLDHEIGEVLGLLDEETVVLVVSDHGARPIEGAFAVNEWLLRQGHLALGQYPDQVTPLEQLAVDWSRTRAWSTGGYYGRIFLNLQGREPAGTIAAADYEHVRDALKAELEATTDPAGRPLGTRVFKPEEVYARVERVAPDLIVHFGDLAWRAVGGVGYQGRVHLQENDTGPDDCNHAQYGAFVLAGPGVQAVGELEGARLLDVAPTLLELGGYDVPGSMQGRSLVGAVGAQVQATSSGEAVRAAQQSSPDGTASPDAFGAGEDAVRERLKGLGYIA